MFFSPEVPFTALPPLAVDPTIGQEAIEAGKLDPSPPPPPPTAEQLQAVEAYFAHKDESQVVAGLLGLWTSTALLHDLAVEHLGKRSGEFEEEESEREKKQPRLGE